VIVKNIFSALFCAQFEGYSI